MSSVAAAGSTKQARTRAESKAVHANAEKRSQYKPVIVQGISPGELITVTPKQFDKIDIDPSYQRGETYMVGQIVRALLSGGSVLDPVTLCQRKGSDTMWVVDGHQRVCAFQQVGKPFTAMLHKSESAEAERQFFIALNAKNSVSANVIVKAWNGPSGAMLRKANESPEHPLYDRINFQAGGNESRLSASAVMHALLAVTGAYTSGRTEVVMARIDLAISSKSMARARAEHFLRLLGMISPKGMLPYLVIRAIAEVARERWDRDVYLPKRSVIERLSNRNWAADTILILKYLSVLVDSIRKIWKEPKE